MFPIVYRKPRDAHEHRHAPQKLESAHQSLKLTDQYLALLVLVLSNAGLLDVSPKTTHIHSILILCTRL